MKQLKKYHVPFILLCYLMNAGLLTAQLNGFLPVLSSSGTINSNGTYYQDYIIPSSMNGKILHMTLTGADGGRVRSSEAQKWNDAGQGATVELEATIGSAANQIKPGATVRFIVGLKGVDRTAATTWSWKSGGAGGGTGVAFKNPGDKWILLAVAGAGTGARGNAIGSGTDLKGKEGRGIEYVLASAGTGKGGGPINTDLFVCVDVYSPGGGAFSDGVDAHYSGLGCNRTVEGGDAGWPNGPDSGEPTGGGGHSAGSWGFGGGGGSLEPGGVTHRGGGGGYAGGKQDEGGSSFLNAEYASGYATTHGSNSSCDDGNVAYSFNTTSNYSPKEIKFSYATGRCIGANIASTSSLTGTNISTLDCGTDAYKVNWQFKNNAIQLGAEQSYCLDLSNGNTNNGANIQLWECGSGNDNQYWVYNGIYKTFHSKKNLDKCIDAANGHNNTTSTVNIALWDCGYTNDNQKWTVEGAATAGNQTGAKHIVPVLATGFAVHSHTGAESGSNIQLWTKDDTNLYEQWYFDGLAIKMRNQNLCVDLNQSNTSNGNNIQLYNCNSTNAQKWIYDGMTQSIRSVINPDKCMQIVKNTDGNVYGKRSNVQIWDCNGSDVQKFQVEEMPCVDDTTPPVAKCRDRVLSALTVPTANTIDNGSTDNCGIATKTIANVSGNTWKLTVTDAAGNSSSCTAAVTYQ
ncbi:MAG: ricin-type beta-trefoil lectin domain protein [Lewinellaceae bacterium]|nr:ricin-type beta-trefoil lectin domain protein [Lewinellaceae bacterium]